MPWRRLHLIEGSVNTVADLELFLERLEMNVTCLGLNGAIKDQIDIANDRRGIGFGCCRCGIELLFFIFNLRDFRGGKLLENILHGGLLGAVMRDDEVLDLMTRGDHLDDIPVESEAEIFQGLGIERIPKRDGQHIPGGRHGNHLVKPGHACGNEMEESWEWFETGEVDGIDSQFRGDGLGKRLLGDEALIDHDILDGTTRIQGLHEKFFAGDLRENASPFENIDDLMRVHGVLVILSHGAGNDLFRSGETGKDLADAILAEGSHSHFPGSVAELERCSTAVDHLTNLVVGHKDLENTHTSAESLATAFFTSNRSHDGCLGEL